MIDQTILHYKIVEKLGEGGMGIVYKAHDTKLKRDVAIKFLPRHIAGNEEERERFRIEAQAAAALNHPNIATIHNIEDVADESFIVMEYIEGQELKQIVGATGPVAATEAVEYALQIASGLQAAHEKDVVHRDIKSANIMVTDKGQVRIMDFGLAKVRGGAQVTKVGTTLGTAAYMSPEQARGEEADNRSDIWAFGVVLYEMLTGKLPFGGDYEQAVFYSVVNEEPKPLTELLPDAPPELQQIIERSLQKERSERYQSMSELLSDLRPSSDDASTIRISPAPDGNRKPKTGLVAGAAIGLVALTALFFYFQRDVDTKTIRLTNPKKITQAIGLESYPAWSPDGTRIVYTSYQGGRVHLWMKQLSGGEPVMMTDDSDGRRPSWSPDGSQIAFVSWQDGPHIYLMPAIGGPRRLIGTISSTSNPVWSADGTRLAAVNRDSTGLPGAEIYRLSSYEKSKVALPGEQFERLYLSWSPNGDYFAYSDADNSYWLASISTIRIVRISDGSSYQIINDGSLDFSPAWSRDNRHLYFASDRGGTTDLWQVDINADGSPDKHAKQISHGLGLHSLSFSSDQTKIAFSKEQRTQNLWRVAIPARGEPAAKWTETQQLTFETSMILRPHLSPDGKRVYFDSNRSGNEDLWSMPAAGGELRQLTTAPEADDNLNLSPDGSTLAFVSERSGRREIWTMPAGGGPARQITDHQYAKYWPRWSPNGESIAFLAVDPNSNLNFWVVPAQGGKAKQVTSTGLVFSPLWWPDGESLVSSDRIHLYRFPIAGGEPQLISTPGVRVRQDGLRWSSDKKQIYFLGNQRGAASGINIWSLTVETGELRQLTDFSARSGRLDRQFAADGTYLYFTWRQHTGDIWVMDVERED